jgi:FMN phosphatase YigB (HAD superfamily)
MINFSKKFFANREETDWVLVDFDGTIHPYDKKNKAKDFPIKNPPLRGARETLQEIRKHGYKIIVYTARHWSEHKSISEYLRHYQIPFDAIICGKVFGVLMIDDRAFRLTDWRKDRSKILRLLAKKKNKL